MRYKELYDRTLTISSKHPFLHQWLVVFATVRLVRISLAAITASKLLINQGRK